MKDRRIAGTGGRGRRRKHLLDNRKETREYRKLKEEALDRILWRTHYVRGYGPVLKQTMGRTDVIVGTELSRLMIVSI